MKPIIITTNKEGNTEFAQKEFKELIDKVYNEGFCDGQRAAAAPFVVDGNSIKFSDESWEKLKESFGEILPCIL